MVLRLDSSGKIVWRFSHIPIAGVFFLVRAVSPTALPARVQPIKPEVSNGRALINSQTVLELMGGAVDEKFIAMKNEYVWLLSKQT